MLHGNAKWDVVTVAKAREQDLEDWRVVTGPKKQKERSGGRVRAGKLGF